MIFFHLRQKCQKLWRGWRCARVGAPALKVGVWWLPWVSRSVGVCQGVPCQLLPPSANSKSQWLVFLARARNPPSPPKRLIITRQCCFATCSPLFHVFSFLHLPFPLTRRWIKSIKVHPTLKILHNLGGKNVFKSEHKHLPGWRTRWTSPQLGHLALQRYNAGVTADKHSYLPNSYLVIYSYSYSYLVIIHIQIHI